MEKHVRLTIIIGVLLVVFISLNVLFAFGKIPGSGVGLITGTAGSVPATCQEVIGGVKCGDAFYPLKQKNPALTELCRPAQMPARLRRLFSRMIGFALHIAMISACLQNSQTN